MRRVPIICEGQTEASFVRSVMAPAMVNAGLNLQGITVNTSPGHKGGALSYARFVLATKNALAQKSTSAVSCLIDLYQLDTDFPGFAQARTQPHLQARLQTLERALHADIVSITGCDPKRFVAHIQPHEFEALLFSDLASLTALEIAWGGALAELEQLRERFTSPEDINQGPTTKPSAQLLRVLHAPGYRKLRHGPVAAQRMGLATIAKTCPHFGSWLQRLRTL